MKAEMVEKLNVLWKHLDDACGSLDNAIHEGLSIEGLPSEIRDDLESIDFSKYVAIKEKVEEHLNDKLKI